MENYHSPPCLYVYLGQNDVKLGIRIEEFEDEVISTGRRRNLERFLLARVIPDGHQVGLRRSRSVEIQNHVAWVGKVILWMLTIYKFTGLWSKYFKIWVF